MRRPRRTRGQAILLAVLALSIFVIAGVGLVVDGAQIFANNQMAQSAADAAAIAGIMSIFDGTNATGANPFGTSSAHTCTTTDGTTPCVFARSNGFGQTASDTVVYDFPPGSNYPGVSFAGVGANLIRVTITRSLNNTLMKLLGSATATSKAIAVAAIVDVMAPVPIIVLHPTLSGAFSINGTPTITICGGPSRSIQVNSSSTTSISLSGGSNTVDLSRAGINDPGNCSTGTGADFGDWGGPKNYPGTLLLGSTGHYVAPASPINDPLAGVPAPTAPGAPVHAPYAVSNPIAPTAWGCPAGSSSCTHYWPGLYPAGITVDHTIAFFEPGLYYVSSGGFNLGTLSGANMAPSTCPVGPPPDQCTTPPSDFSLKRGMLVYNSGNTKDDRFSFDSNAGNAPGGITLVGSDNTFTSNYKGILFFQDRGVTIAHNGVGANKAHAIQGSGNISLTGTLYVTNNNTSNYQTVHVQGSAGSSTVISGEIITDALDLGGNAGIKMNLDPTTTLHIRQVALVQ